MVSESNMTKPIDPRSNAQLLEKIKDVHPIDPPNVMTFNSAMIDVDIPITHFGKLVNSKRWVCMYSESGLGSGIHGTYIDKETGSMFQFTATKRWIHLIPRVRYNPQSLVDFYLWIRSTISKYAILMSYTEYQDLHKDDTR